MPTTTPLAPELRQQIGDDIAAGFGRNEIARKYGVSPGVVTKICRERHLYFANDWMVGTAAHARQVDLFARRDARIAELEAQLEDLILSGKASRANGKDTRAYKRLTYALYNAKRHHNGSYR
jgi:hypothetical protein